MKDKQIPMVSGRKASLPRIYGDTPSFLGCPVIDQREVPSGFDVVVAGVPWEGTVTWGSFSGCELAPKSIRHAAARYGGFLPEYEIDFFDHLTLADAGDVTVHTGDEQRTMQNVREFASRVYSAGSIPVLLGGDHSFSPEAVQALADNRGGRIGVIHFDSHMDNSETFGEDVLPRCGPLHRIARIDEVDPVNIVHIGIRGPRNAPAQYHNAKELGSTIFTMKQVRKRGMEAIISDAISLAGADTDFIYVTICSDCVDVGFNPGGPADFFGLTPGELFIALFTLGEHGIDGLDIAEIYPQQDPNSISSHLASWAIIYALAGVASGRKGQAL
jgi:agmatinase